MKKKITLYSIVFFLFIVAYFYYRYSVNQHTKRFEKLKKEYPAISLNEELNAKITKVYHGVTDVTRNHPHQAYLTLDNKIKKRIRTGYSINKNFFLDDVLKIGQTIQKKQETDTIIIYEYISGDTLEYIFRLKDDLGYPIK
jgi:hypothetical protein